MKAEKQGTIQFFHSADLPHVHIVRGINVTNRFSRHVHRGLTIGIVLKGERVISQRGLSTIIQENDVFVINSGESHACHSRCNHHSYFSICVNAEFIKSVALRIPKGNRQFPYFANIRLRDSDLNSRMRHFFSMVTNDGSTREKESALLSVLSTLILLYASKPPKPQKVDEHEAAIDRACTYITEHYARNISLKELSHFVHISPFYFHRLFLRSKGRSPHEYLTQFRIKKAIEFLDEGRDIVGVALDTGFVDQSHFSRSFKQITGMTPGCYLRTAVAGR